MYNSYKKNMILLVIILVMGLFIAGGTFAYMEWATLANEATGVAFTTLNRSNDLKASLDSDTQEFSGMYFAEDCNGEYARMTPVRLYYQNTSSLNSQIVPKI